jgi:hypothetical protein
MDERIKRSRTQERDGAKRYGGTVNSRSGAGDTRKNDVRTDDLSIEFKSTRQASYSLKRDDLAVAWQHAIVDHREVIFGVEFASRAQQKAPAAPRRWVVLPEDDYLAQREKAAQPRLRLADESEDDGW